MTRCKKKKKLNNRDSCILFLQKLVLSKMIKKIYNKPNVKSAMSKIKINEN